MTCTKQWSIKMTEQLPKPQEVLDKFLQRDAYAVKELVANPYGKSDSSRLDFVDARCQDTGSMIAYILKYLVEQETQMVYILKYLVEQETKNGH
jgi:hypothetical protein